MQAILICNAGMSSSLMAKKVSEQLKRDGYDIKVNATTIGNSEAVFRNADYQLVLVSPQIRMLFDEYQQKAEKMGKQIAQIPFNAYAPTPMGIKNMETIILNQIEGKI
ncbi:MAG: PTS cellobiose transporter subunit IIB [Aerococcus sp.]|nr:PTS cellobiose transporter subunit IIB [Aerococcus sp.]